jgi:hypothetical protein
MLGGESLLDNGQVAADDSAASNVGFRVLQPNLGGLDFLHAFDGVHGTLNQHVGLKLDPVSGLGLDAVPKPNGR